MDLFEYLLGIPQSRSARAEFVRTIKDQVVMILYWSAILLPMIYLTLLVTRIRSDEKLVLFLALVGLHLVALVGGQRHRRTIG